MWILVSGEQPCAGSSPVIIRVLLSVTAFRSDSADNVLSVCTHQLHRMDGQMLVQISTALGSIGAQMAFVFSLFWGKKTPSDNLKCMFKC